MFSNPLRDFLFLKRLLISGYFSEKEELKALKEQLIPDIENLISEFLEENCVADYYWSQEREKVEPRTYALTGDVKFVC